MLEYPCKNRCKHHLQDRRVIAIHLIVFKMPLEATMMIIDNSEYMRNGDYQPTRLQAQADAVNVVFQTKIDSNPENTVGIMTMAQKG